LRRASAALALALAACAHQASCAAERELPRPVPRDASPRPSAGLRALLLGDFGDATDQQRAVAAGIAAAHAREPFDVAFSLGDNLYECGPDPSLPGASACAFGDDDNGVAAGYRSPDDPRFERLIEGPLAFLGAGPRPVPLHAVLGNHDVAASGGCAAGDLPPAQLARVRACLEVARRGPLGRMPGRHYVVDAGPARFIAIDSNLAMGDYGGFTLETELAFVRQAAEGCASRPCFVIAHHPPATAGGHYADVMADRAMRFGRIEEAAGGRIAAWIAGHDHDLQHLRAAAGYDTFVSGNGSRWRRESFSRVEPQGARLLFASTSWGHAVLEASATSWSVRFESHAGEPLHCCSAVFPGRCEPGACPPPAAPAPAAAGQVPGAGPVGR